MRLTDDERTTLGNIAASLVTPSGTSALCAYGSKVAGYARPDSDYDLMIVAKNFREGVRYKYIDRPMAVSSLIVDEGLLDQDARSSSLGEFVVGRFLNVYEPMANAKLLHTVEREYKMRVIVEALLELSSDYGEFCRHLLVPFDYFLFDKLRKRSVVYPPALYSYVQTYSCALGRENRALSAEGFKYAAESLLPRGFFKIEDGGVRIIPEKMKGDAFTKVQSLFALTTRGVTQYAVHGYAGRVRFSVFRKEAQSKLRRIRERPDPMPELESPRALLRLEEGVVVPDPSQLEKEVAKVLGYDKFTVKEKLIGDPYSTTSVLTFTGGGRETSIVLKNFSDVRSLKWAFLGVWAAAANRFAMTPLARMEREYAVTRALRLSGVLVPAIIAVSPDVRILVKEFVEGPTLSKVIDDFFRGEGSGLENISTYGRLVAKVHAAGYALGDAKASNVIICKRGPFLTDLEQAEPGGDKAWDLAEFVYYTAKLSTREREMEQVARAFLQAYASDGDRKVVARACHVKYLSPFQPFLLPGMAKTLRSLMSDFA
jgi:tRNA A-37 threonylcarbamoyl transferase component Bud32/predicted nucleotidyltransferase